MRVSIYQKNMKFDNDKEYRLAKNILNSGAKVATLQEVNRDNDVIKNYLNWPTFHYHWTKDIGKVAIASQYEVLAEKEGTGWLGLLLDTEVVPAWVFTVHLETPRQSETLQLAQARELGRVLYELDGPIVVGGDLNCTRTEQPYRIIRDKGELNPIGEPVGTYPVVSLFGLNLYNHPIDHILARSAFGEVIKKPLLGSDHYGLYSDVIFR